VNRLTVTNLRLENFRKFARPVQLSGLGPGLNLLCAPNEAGKSTLKTALDAVFFSRHRLGGQAAEAMRTQGNDAPPAVQVRFTLGEGEYTLTKRFHRQQRARLLRPDGSLAEGDAAEQEIQRLLGFQVPNRGAARPELLGVWGLLWVAQGDSFMLPEVNAAARGSLEACLAEGGVAAITGGARGHRVAETVRSELAKLLTPGRRQPTGRYAQVIEERKEAEREFETARALKAELAERLRDLELTRRDLDAEKRGIDPEAEEREIAGLRGQLREAQRLADQTANAKLTLDLAERRLGNAQEAADRRRDAVEQQARAEAVATEAKAEYDRESAVAGEAATRFAAAQRAYDQAEAARRGAERRMQRLARRTEWQRKREAAQQQGERLEQALASARQAASARNEANSLPADDAALKKLRTLAGKRDSAAAARTAAATVLRFALTEGGAATLRLAGEAVGPSGELALTRPAFMDLGALGQVEIRPGVQDPAAIDQALADAEAGFSDALEALGVASTEEAEAQVERRRHLLQVGRSADEKARLFVPSLEGNSARIAEALEAVRVEIGEIEAALAEDVEDDDEAASEEEAVADLQRAEQARQACSDSLSRERQSHALAEQRWGQAAKAFQRTRDAHVTAARSLQAARAAESDETQTEEIAAAREALEAALQRYKDSHAKSAEGGPPERIEEQIKRLERARDERGKRMGRLREVLASLEAQVGAKSEQGPDEAIAHAEERLGRLTMEYDRMERDVAALTLLDHTLREAQASVEAQYLTPVTAKLSPHLAALFGEAELGMNGDFSLQRLCRADTAEDVAQLSHGTQEQLAILTRLAFAEVLAEQGRPVVLLLDDALVYADDRRIQDMFSALERAAERFQVIVLSCRQRVFDGLGGDSQRRLSIEPAEAIEF